jgi:hypothetical protein
MHAENASKTALVLGIVMTTVGTALLIAIGLGIQ